MQKEIIEKRIEIEKKIFFQISVEREREFAMKEETQSTKVKVKRVGDGVGSGLCCCGYVVLSRKKNSKYSTCDSKMK
jgi:hypothetical protein